MSTLGKIKHQTGGWRHFLRWGVMADDQSGLHTWKTRDADAAMLWCCQWKRWRVIVQRLWTEVPLADWPVQPPESLQLEGKCNSDTPQKDGGNATSLPILQACPAIFWIFDTKHDNHQNDKHCSQAKRHPVDSTITKHVLTVRSSINFVTCTWVKRHLKKMHCSFRNLVKDVPLSR